jgi:hypothetical protein
MAGLLYKCGNRLIKLSNRQPPPNRFLSFAAPGHYYSPIPDAAFVEKNAGKLFSNEAASLPGIELDRSRQRELVEELLKYGGDFKPPANAEEARAAGARFYTSNGLFKELDAYIYHGMLRHKKPARIVEVGAGFTSVLAMDVCEKHVRPVPRMTLTDPDSERLHGLLRGSVPEYVSMVAKPVQEVEMNLFLELGAGDFLFVDSSHVAKIGSDVNFLFFEVFPRLKKGVIIHVHDIFWPFEYPQSWLREGRCWNEAYLLRALLSDSRRYRILCSSSYLASQERDLLKKFPGWVSPEQSSSIWLEVAP